MLYYNGGVYNIIKRMASAEYKLVEIDSYTIGGQHLSNYIESSVKDFWNGYEGIQPLKEKFVEKTYDFLILQGHTQESRCENWFDTLAAVTRRIFESLKADTTDDMTILLYQTMPSIYPTASSPETAEELLQGYENAAPFLKKYISDHGAEWSNNTNVKDVKVAPTGRVVKFLDELLGYDHYLDETRDRGSNLRDVVTDTARYASDTWRRAEIFSFSRGSPCDCVHPNARATYLISCLFYFLVFGESPVGNGFKYVGMHSEDLPFYHKGPPVVPEQWSGFETLLRQEDRAVLQALSITALEALGYIKLQKIP